ncbi:Hypothetical predicted protein [Pelobates cultripes]|uniref:Uncharacterized protein n=1 Tax=Pelobates cultripes TaxID=61616 RepID=A0AAD1SCS9_PELCU|nr:Hypothetical predicted protein [Pelobates cultripes]
MSLTHRKDLLEERSVTSLPIVLHVMLRLWKERSYVVPACPKRLVLLRIHLQIQMAGDKSMEQQRANKRPRTTSHRDREDSDSDASFVEAQSEEGKEMYSSEEHMDVKTIEKLIRLSDIH